MSEFAPPLQFRHYPSMFKSATPILRASSSSAAEKFYCQLLGFTKQFAYRFNDAQPDPCYMGLSRDGARLHVSSFSGDGVFGSAVFLVVGDLDALYAELKAKGVTVDMEPTEQSWGNREMYVHDPDGNSIRFIQGGG
jgi:uncharacterized glyoxalase superfamily protein PhnB